MASGQSRDRGRDHGPPHGNSLARGGDRGGARRGFRGDRGEGGGSRSDRVDRGAYRGSREGHRGGRGGGRDEHGGPPPGGQSVQLPSHGPPNHAGAGVYLDEEQPSPPKATIRAQEDALVADTRGKVIDGFPGRHSYGTRGTEIVLRTNYLSVTTAYEADRPQDQQTFYRYNMDFQPEPSRPKRKLLIAHVLKDPMFDGKIWATDYGRLIVTTTRLDLGTNAAKSRKVLIPSENESDQSSDQNLPADFVIEAQRRNTVKVTISYSNSYNVMDLVQYLQDPSSRERDADLGDLIQLLNIIVCKPPSGSATVSNVGQNKFYPFHGNTLAESFDLGGGLQALRGYYSSVRPAVGRILLNLNPTSGAFYQPIPLTELLRRFGGSLEQCESFVHRLRVKAKYLKDTETTPFMTKIKTIVGFAKPLSPPSIPTPRFGNASTVKFTFVDRSIPDAQPQTTTVYDYFLRHHGITLRHPELPVLNTGTRTDPQYLPPELCTVLPGQPYRRLLQADQTSAMIRFAARYPKLNAMSIAGTTNRPGPGLQLFSLANATNEGDPQATSVQPFGFRIGTSLISVPGRILPSPRVMYASDKTASVVRASWNLRGLKFCKGGAFAKWKALVISHNGPRGNPWQGFTYDHPSAEHLFSKLERDLESYGIEMGTRLATHELALDALDEANRVSNDRKLTEAFQKAKEDCVDVLFVILPGQDPWLYSRIKLYGDIKYGIHTIDAIGRKFQKPQGIDMFIGNLALKFNVKGGGVSHKVPDTLLPPAGNNTILFGIDVTHPSPGSSEGAPSIACVVANTDEKMFQWPGSIRTQTGRVEMVERLKEMVLERLKLWRKKNNKLPDKVIVYRDGVSEGQFHLVLRNELPSFQDAYRELYGGPAEWPKTAIVIVGKRHQTRFYATHQDEADGNPSTGRGSWNTQPGTVVDRGITGRVIHEFFLQPHQGLQGTVRPVHYSVIKDDLGFSADQLERLTLNLCYHFVRCTKAVSICPPAYYADLLSKRGRAYLFSTLQENHGSGSSVFEGASAEWTGGVHPDLSESTFYI